jgi:hypothetical protein
LGRIEEYDNLPENINFDEPSATNISIGEVQRSLLSEFEQELNNNCNSILLSKVLKFYNEEKEAIEQLFQIIGTKENFLGCTPFFAENHPEIHTSLSQCIDGMSVWKFDGSLLNVGILYKVQGEKYRNYSDAKILSARSIAVIKEQNAAQIRLLFSVTNIQKIKTYDELYEKFISDLQNCLSEDIKNANSSYKTLIANYLIICQVLPNQNIKFALSNFAYNECLRRLNNNSISPQEAIALLTEVQNVIKDNVRLNNFIPDVKLSDLVEKLNNNRISLINGLQATCDLYLSYMNHQRICENLVIVCNNAIDSEIIGDTSSSNQVQRILDTIIANRSPTFRDASRQLAIQYQTFMNSLDINTKRLIAGGSVYGQSLNAQGKALKRGLDYLQRLSL